LEDWALIRRLAADGVPKARIAARLGISRTTVIKAVKSDSPPRYERSPGPTSFTEVEPHVRALLAEVPDMPATVLAERVSWTGSIRWFSENVKRLRPGQRPVDPADRITWSAGDAAQCDLWFPPRKIPLEDGTTKLLPVLVITAAHSRFMVGRMIPTRKTEDLAAPVDRLDADRAAMLPLPPIPLHLGWRNKIRLGRDYYVRLDTNDYSVDPKVIGRMVDVAADLERVRIRAEGRMVAEHERVWARGMTVTDPAHVEAAAWLRKQFQQPRAAVAGDDLAQDLAQDLVRDLSDYDRAFGLGDQEGIN
jgi:Mu transposase-like protein/helix-turn-helix resolvase-like protein